jgi:hypothetical protein
MVLYDHKTLTLITLSKKLNLKGYLVKDFFYEIIKNIMLFSFIIAIIVGLFFLVSLMLLVIVVYSDSGDTGDLVMWRSCWKICSSEWKNS